MECRYGYEIEPSVGFSESSVDLSGPSVYSSGASQSFQDFSGPISTDEKFTSNGDFNGLSNGFEEFPSNNFIESNHQSNNWDQSSRNDVNFGRKPLNSIFSDFNNVIRDPIDIFDPLKTFDFKNLFPQISQPVDVEVIGVSSEHKPEPKVECLKEREIHNLTELFENLKELSSLFADSNGPECKQDDSDLYLWDLLPSKLRSHIIRIANTTGSYKGKKINWLSLTSDDREKINYYPLTNLVNNSLDHAGEYPELVTKLDTTFNNLNLNDCLDKNKIVKKINSWVDSKIDEVVASLLGASVERYDSLIIRDDSKLIPSSHHHHHSDPFSITDGFFFEGFYFRD